jgi:hypothetical protein
MSASMPRGPFTRNGRQSKSIWILTSAAKLRGYAAPPISIGGNTGKSHKTQYGMFSRMDHAQALFVEI